MKYAPANQTVDFGYGSTNDHQGVSGDETVVVVHNLPNNSGIMIEAYAPHEAQARHIRGNRRHFDYGCDYQFDCQED